VQDRSQFKLRGEPHGTRNQSRSDFSHCIRTRFNQQRFLLWAWFVDPSTCLSTFPLRLPLQSNCCFGSQSKFDQLIEGGSLIRKYM
jgi:hypothetical protein